MAIKKAGFAAVNDPAALPLIIEQLTRAMEHLAPGSRIKITVELDDDITKYRKRYFAMVTELAKYAGYLSHKDRETFKEQVRNMLAIRSIAEIDTTEEMGLAIEAVHQLAAEHYHYTFIRDASITNGNSRIGNDE